MAVYRKQLLGAYQFRVLCRTLMVFLCLGGASSQAATRTWTGGHASSGNWNLRDNWGGVAVPTNGDTVLFPAGAARLNNTNNIAGLRLQSILFDGLGGGYVLRGNGVSLSNGITVVTDSDNTIRLDSLSLGGTQTFNVPPGAGLTIFSDITLSPGTLNLAAIGDLTIRGAISGTGDINKTGAGQLSLSGVGANTFNGSLTIASGTLAVNKFETISFAPLTQVSRIAIPGDLILGNGSGAVTATIHFEDQIANTATVTVRENATLNFNGHDDAVGDLVLSGGEIATGAGTLFLNGDVTALASSSSSSISGQLALTHNTTLTVSNGTAFIDLDLSAKILALTGVIKEGTGTLRLSGTNGYFGATTINAGKLHLANDLALGPPNSGTTVNEGAEMFLEAGVNTLREPLTIVGSGFGGASGAIRIGNSLTIATNIVLSGPATIDVIGGATEFTIEGVISGVGPLTKIGEGTLELAGNGANTFSGELLAEQGVLLLSKLSGSAVQGDLIIGTSDTTATARHTRSANLGGAVTVNGGSLYDLDGVNESIDSLTLNGGGDVQTGTGLLTLDGDIAVNAGLALIGSTSTIDGRLGVGSGTRNIIVAETGGIGGDSADLRINAQISGSAAIIKGGTGDLSLTGANTFTGQLTVQDGELHVSNDQALGSTAANTMLTGDAMLQVSGDVTVDENLFLNSAGKTNVGVLRNQGDNLWTGSIFLGQQTVVNVPTNSVLDISGVINGLSGLTKTGPGTLIYSGTSSNTYIGTTFVNEGTLQLARTGGSGRAISGALVIGDGVGGVAADVVEIDGTDSQISRNSDVTVNDTGLLDIKPGTLIQLIGSLAGSGRVRSEGSSLRVGYNDASTVFSGILSGSGDFWKFGDGTLTLESNNTLTGITRANGGTLVINGQQESSDVFVLGPGTLRGNGKVGHLTVLGRFAPGNSGGWFRAASLSFQPGSTFQIDLNGDSSGTSYNWVSSEGPVDLTGASLELSLGYAPVAGERFTVIENHSEDPINSTFDGLPEGEVVHRNHIPLQLTYEGWSGGGNDVILTIGGLGLRFDSARVEAGNGNGRIDPGECNELYVAVMNPTAGPVVVISAHLQSLDPRIMVTQSRSEYGNVPTGGIRTNTTAFQVRVSEGFPCGEPARFHLVVNTLADGRFAIPVTFETGQEGPFNAYHAQGVPRPIPDGVLVSIPLEVTNNFRIARARVKVHATHSSVGQLKIGLRGPYGVTSVLLSDNRGGAGNNFGLNCESPTTFTDQAVVSVTAGVAPFMGAFRPEETLAVFDTKESAGTWYLDVLDSVPGVLGSIQCWSLELSPYVCSEGSGECATCISSTAGALTDSSPSLAERLNRQGPPSGCGDAIPCGGTSALGHPPYRYSTHQFTNNGPATCVTVALTVPCDAYANGLMASAYLNDFVPSDPCANLLGDSGVEIFNGSGGFSFPVPAGSRFTVVVNEINQNSPSSGCGNYTLELHGLPCPQEQPTLYIANDVGPDNVRLHWSTAYPGFDLQGRPSLGGLVIGGFTNVNSSPVVIDGHYSVTNSHNGKGNGFFRLRKP